MIGLVRQVSHSTGISTDACRRIAKSAYLRYKKFAIPKKNGDLRLVAQPAREVKAVQRAIVDILKGALPVHSAATAYEEDCSIAKNAASHRDSLFLSKFDFSDFFPSISADDIEAVLRERLDGVSDAEVKFVVDACTWRPGARSVLCLGAPSSPFISNAVMHRFDEEMTSFCAGKQVSYTRYSDDIAISTVLPDVLVVVESHLRTIVANMQSPKLRLNDRKRVAAGRGTAMRVTGLTLANDGRVTVGRIRKRGVRAGIHKYLLGRLPDEEISKLKGELAFVLDVEPDFASVLVATYGASIVLFLPARHRERFL